MENTTVNTVETVKVKGSKVTLPSIIGPIAVQLVPEQDEATAEKVSVLQGKIKVQSDALADLKVDIEEDGRSVETSKAYQRKAYDLQMRRDELTRLAPEPLKVETLNAEQCKLVNGILAAITAWCDPIVRKRYAGTTDETGTTAEETETAAEFVNG